VARWLLATDLLVGYLRDPDSVAARWLDERPVGRVAVCGLSLAWILARSDASDVPPDARAAWRARIDDFRGRFVAAHGLELGLDVATLHVWGRLFHKELDDPVAGPILPEERFVVALAIAAELVYTTPPRAWLAKLQAEDVLVIEVVG
jgi:hypothetical protein